MNPSTPSPTSPFVIHETPCGSGRMIWHAWGEGPPVVLLHGGAGSWTHWLRNIGALVAAGHSVYAPDMPGCGDSDPPPAGDDAYALVEPVSQGLAQLLGRGGVPVAAFSYGGRVAALIAERQPELVSTLVLVGAPLLDRTPNPPVLTSWRNLPTDEERMAAHRANLAAMMLAREESITPLAVSLQAWNATRDRLRRRNSGEMEELLRVVSRIACPVHAIYGCEDVFYRDRLDALGSALESLPTFAGLTLVERAGHWVAFEAPEPVNAALLAIVG